VKIKDVSIFGSTGSIGVNTLSVIADNLSNFNIIALIANENYKLLVSQARKFRPKYIVIKNSSYYSKIKDELSDIQNITILHGDNAVSQTALIKCDLFISAIVGVDGLLPTYNAICSGSDIALANKESIICAGNFMLDLARKKNVKIIPIDSEHNAIFQLLNNKVSEINNVTITASGGPFFNKDINFKNITVKQAVKHPIWSMGKKISVDSATMVNKALEVIEAYYLFSLKIEQIKVIIHPQSIIHGILNYKDGSSHSVMSFPDMKIPISYCLTYPERQYIYHQELNLAKISKLEFYEIDEDKYQAIKLCKAALEIGGNMPIIFNMANEIAVKYFLGEMITFDKIINIINDSINTIKYCNFSNIDNIIDYCQHVKRQIIPIANKYHN
jgi:1-deoxy-D-xylulose-5-phosphate reductoisomerase